MMEIISQILLYINVAVAMTSAYLNMLMSKNNKLPKAKRVVYLTCGVISAYFAIFYFLSMVGYISNDILGPYILRPAMTGIFFMFIWATITDRILLCRYNQKISPES